MIYPITLYGNAILRKSCQYIVEGDIDVKTLSEDMFKTMHHADGRLLYPRQALQRQLLSLMGLY